MPQWQTTNLGEEGESNRRTEKGGGEKGGPVRKETNNLGDGGRDCGL